MNKTGYSVYNEEQKKRTKKDAIKQLIQQQNAFMKNVNDNGYEDKNYWLNMSEYRTTQENLANTIRNEAHKTHWDEYKDNLKADIGEIE